MENYYSTLGNMQSDELVGGKARMLSALKRLDAPIPDGIVLSVELEKQFLLDASMTIDEMQKAYNCSACHLEMMRELLTNARWDTGLIDELKKAYQLFDNQPVCVRSSAINEDGRHNSFAGIFRTNINIRTFGEFLWAIRDCWLSGVEENAVRYAEVIQCPLSHMALVVQSLIIAVQSGVAVLDNATLTISAAYGQGTGVVSGKVECDTYHMTRELETISENIVSKETAYVANIWDHPICFCEITYPWLHNTTQRFYVNRDDDRSALLYATFLGGGIEENMQPVLDEKQRKELAGLFYHLADQLDQNSNWDFEWCFDAVGTLFIMQARPLLSSIDSEKEKINDEKHIVARGMPISLGLYSGRCVIVNGPDDYGKVQSGDIVYLNVVMDSFVNILSKVGALILGRSASSLSHCAIIAREWKIPCVGDIDRNDVKEFSYYEVDGGNGVIYKGFESLVDSPIPAESESETVSLSMFAYVMMSFECVAAKISTIENKMLQWKTSFSEYASLQEVDCRGVFSVVHGDEDLHALYIEVAKNMMLTVPNSINIIMQEDDVSLLSNKYDINIAGRQNLLIQA